MQQVEWNTVAHPEIQTMATFQLKNIWTCSWCAFRIFKYLWNCPIQIHLNLVPCLSIVASINTFGFWFPTESRLPSSWGFHKSCIHWVYIQLCNVHHHDCEHVNETIGFFINGMNPILHMILNINNSLELTQVVFWMNQSWKGAFFHYHLYLLDDLQFLSICRLLIKWFKVKERVFIPHYFKRIGSHLL